MDDFSVQINLGVYTKQINECKDIEKLRGLTIQLLQCYFAQNQMLRMQFMNQLPVKPSVNVVNSRAGSGNSNVEEL